ncbi:hypothetical protein FRX31_010180, partial [Thalictrum thalictroides]
MVGGRARAVKQPYGVSLWKGIMNLFSVFISCLRCNLGKGKCIRFWFDEWVGDKSLCLLFPTIFSVSNNKQGTVHSMKQQGTSAADWDFSLRRPLYDWEQSQLTDMLVLLANVSFGTTDDSWRWKDNRSGVFSVSSFYDKLSCIERPANEIMRPFPYFLVWGTHVVPLCSSCGLLNETISHLFLHCLLALQVWSELLKPRQKCYALVLTADSVEELLIVWPKGKGLQLGKKVWDLLPYAIMWVLWRVRNEKIFRNKMSSIEMISMEVKATCWLTLLLGPPGAGKSTLLLALVGKLANDVQ